jgi:hypothetical protein
MRLIHYSREPLTEVKNGNINKTHGICKPAGLWVSVEGPNDWPSWCAAENFGSERDFANATEVILRQGSVLLLETAAAIDEFTGRYVEQRGDAVHRWSRTVAWAAVAKQWSGLIIAPYRWDRRLTDHTFWYYCWDCASGVIWDASAVAALKPLPVTPRSRFSELIFDNEVGKS